MRKTLLMLLLALVLVAWPAAPLANADVGTKIIERCTHGQSIAGFSQQDYRRALEETTAEVNEYSDCVNLIHKAQLAAAGHGVGGGGGGGAGGGGGLTANVAPPTPAEQRALQAAHSSGATPVKVGGQTVAPGVVHANIASAVSSLPTPLLALLAFLLAGALSILARAIRERVSAHREH
jgi:Tfp pilus assembly protein FimV